MGIIRSMTGLCGRGWLGSIFRSGLRRSLRFGARGERLAAAVERAERAGVLRLRDCFASRNSHFAQDDNLGMEIVS